MFPVAIMVSTCAMMSGIGGAALFIPIYVLIFPLLGPEYPFETTVLAVIVSLITMSFSFASGVSDYAYEEIEMDNDQYWRFYNRVRLCGDWRSGDAATHIKARQ
jgi:hypothetical protein